MIQKMGKRLKDQRGLTLVELLAVIVILAIIGTIAIVAIGGIIDNSKRDAIKSDAIQLINAANLYKSEHGTLPANEEALKDYVEISNKWTDLSFSAVDNSTVISGTGENGGVTITFTKASIKAINSAGKKDTAIP